MSNYITVTDALATALHTAMGGTSVLQSIQFAFAIRKLMNRWLANEIAFDEVLKFIDRPE